MAAPKPDQGMGDGMDEERCLTDAILVVGSNIDREHNLPEAIRLVRRHHDIDVRSVSRVYESPAVGGPDGAPEFWNAALRVCTRLTPQELRAELRRIEEQMGRVRTDDRNAPRVIDLDIGYFGDRVADFGDWALPDPAVSTAAHAAIPVADVAPDWVHPESGLSAEKIAAGFQDDEVRPAASMRLASAYMPPSPADFDDITETFSPRLEALVRQQLVELGEDPDREGLVRTPLRVAKALDYLTSGYTQSLDEVVNGAIFDAEGGEEMVLVKGIEFYSMCEHHMLPFFGTATVAYLPRGKILGLSKVARIVDLFARRLQVQERLTNQVADAMAEALDPYGVAVVIDGKHLCMMMRGVQKQDTVMVTSAMRGTFREDARTRNEFLDLAKR